MTKSRFFIAMVILLIAVIGLPQVAQGEAQFGDILIRPLYQSSPNPFLFPPYFDSEEVNCVFDHEYPIYFFGEKDFGEPISSTVVHNDGIRRDESGITTPGCYSGHDGIDYSLRYEKVLASASGTVTRARWNYQNHQSGLGLYVRIDHANSYSTFYGHLSAVSVQEDTQILAGKIIGVSGNSGNSTGPHLHFTVRGPSNVANPYGWIGSSQIPTDPWLTESNQSSTNLWTQLPSTTNDIYPSGEALPTPVPPQPGQPNVVLIEDATPVIGAGCQQASSGGYLGGSFRYATVISDSLSANPPASCSMRWNIPSGGSGTFDVYAYIPAANANTEGALYQIIHQGTPSQAIVHQAHFPDNQWAYLGQYAFSRDGSEYITASNVTLDVTNTLSIAFDALMLAPGIGVQPTLTPTPGPSPTPTRTPTLAPTHTPAEIVYLPMNESNPVQLTEVHGHPVTAVNVVLTPGYSGTAGDNARRFPQTNAQSTPAYSRISLGASEDYYAADTPNRSLTVDLWFRHTGSSTSTQPETIVNLLYEKNGDKRGWELTFTPSSKRLTFAVYMSGLRTPVSLVISSISTSQWTRIKAIRDGTLGRLILCAMPSGGAWLSPTEQPYTGAISYFRTTPTTTPNAPSTGNTLDLGVVYTGWQFNLNANWHGDIDEFRYKNYADYSGGCQPLPTPTQTRTPTPTRTPTGPRLWTATPRALATLPSNSNITITSGDSFRAIHTQNNYWMGGGVLASAREVPVGVVFRWANLNTTLPENRGKRMCYDHEFGPTINSGPCAWPNTSESLTNGLYCTAGYAFGYTPNQICQAVLGQDSLGSYNWWANGTLQGGLGWEQRGSAGSREMLVQDIRLIYYSVPSPDYFSYLPLVIRPVEPTVTPTSSGPDGIVLPTEEPPPDGYPGLSTPTPMPTLVASVTPTPTMTFTKTLTPTRTATFTKTPKPSRTPRP